MKITISSIVVAVLLTLGLQSAGAQSIIGYNKVAVPALTDVLVSVPFTPDAAGAFAVATKTATKITKTAVEDDTVGTGTTDSGTSTGTGTCRTADQRACTRVTRLMDDDRTGARA